MIKIRWENKLQLCWFNKKRRKKERKRREIECSLSDWRVSH